MILATMLACVAVQGGGEATYSAHPQHSDVDYTSPTVTSHELQRFALYYPDVRPPSEGYPVLIHVSNSGLKSTDPCVADGIESEPLYQFLEAGFAVIRSSCTFSNINALGQQCGGGALGPILGNGLFHPPGVTAPGFSQPAYGDPSRPMAEEDVVMLVQHLRHNAAALDLDADRMGIYGRSGGAIISMWVALGPERNGLFGTPAVPPLDQDDQSSKVGAAILRAGSVYFPAYVNATTGVHWPQRNTGPVWETPAPTLQLAVPGYTAAASALVFDDASDPFTNAMDEVYLIYNAPSESSNFSPPYITNTLTDIHSSWNGYAWQERYPNNTRLVLVDEQAKVDLGGGVFAPFHALIEDRGTLAVDQVDYLVEELAVSTVVESTGGGAPSIAPNGNEVTPVLLGCGGFVLGDPGRIGLSLAKPSADAYLVVGYSEANAPFGGGIMGPSPDAVLPVVTTDVGGKYQLRSLVLSDGTTPVELWVQYWIVDDSGPTGVWTGSNTLHLSIP